MFKLRFWKIIITALLRIKDVASSRLRFWVTPFDCDIYLHMNNGSYLKFMDLGRWDIFIRSGTAKYFIRAKLQPVVVNINIDYKKALQPGQFFHLVTTFESSQQKTMKFHQDFYAGTELAASATVTIVVLRHGKVVTMNEVRQALPETVARRFNPDLLA